MKTFKQFHAEEIHQSLVEYLFILENDVNIFEDDMLMEGGISDIFSKLGLKIHRRKGLLQHLKNAGIGVAKLVAFAIKKDKEGVKSVLKGLKKEDVLDFILKLDQATLHIITGPIHFIDAVTGFELWANVQDVASDAKSKIVDAVVKLKNNIKGFFDSKTELIHQKHLDAIRKGT